MGLAMRSRVVVMLRSIASNRLRASRPRADLTPRLPSDCSAESVE
jgi:hypothetical protein